MKRCTAILLALQVGCVAPADTYEVAVTRFTADGECTGEFMRHTVAIDAEEVHRSEVALLQPGATCDARWDGDWVLLEGSELDHYTATVWVGDWSAVDVGLPWVELAAGDRVLDVGDGVSVYFSVRPVQ